MAEVEGSFTLKNGHKFKGKFKLAAERKKRKDDKKKNWKPIKWRGVVNDREVEITQLCAKPSTIEDFEWEGFPKKFDVVKAYIAMAIEDLWQADQR